MFVYLRVDSSLKCPLSVKGRLNPKKQTHKQPIFPSQGWANAPSCLNVRTPMIMNSKKKLNNELYRFAQSNMALLGNTSKELTRRRLVTLKNSEIYFRDVQS